jgi:hypothetical protein
MTGMQADLTHGLTHGGVDENEEYKEEDEEFQDIQDL